ncbi:MAG: tetratricopeptide repeat protein [Candidatus Aceula meridiana]|nr:tetratricopeptide repeat protein [Candidatus Aceula meridiana]
MKMTHLKNLFLNWTDRKTLGVLIASGFLAYLRCIFYPFVHDDLIFIVTNPQINQWDNLVDIFLKSSGFFQGDAIINTYYRPLLEVFYKIEYLFFGLDPKGYHIVNIFLHIANGICIYFLSRILFKRKLLAFFAAALFLLHPVQTESVCAIAGISNLLFSFLCFLSFLFYLNSQKDVLALKKIIRYSLSLFIFLLALLTKERAVIWPFLILLYEGCFALRLTKKSFKEIAIRAGGFFLVLAGYFIFRKIILGASLPEVAFHEREAWLRLFAIPKMFFSYLRLLVAPFGLHYYRSIDILNVSAFWMVGLLGLFHVLGISLWFLGSQARRLAFFSLGWFFISLLPVLGIFPLINEYSFVLASEHFLYFSFFGFVVFALIVSDKILKYLFKEKGKKVFILFFSSVLLIFFGMTISQNQYWRGEIPLFQRTLKYQKDFGRVRILLARAYYFDKKYKKALEEYGKALVIMKKYAHKAKGSSAESFYTNFIKEIYFDRAHCYESLGDFSQAIEEYSLALAIAPRDAGLHNNLGVLYLSMGEGNKAIFHFQKAFEINPTDTTTLNNLAVCYIQKGEKKKAQLFWEQALHSQPDNLVARTNLEKLLSEKE